MNWQQLSAWLERKDSNLDRPEVLRAASRGGAHAAEMHNPHSLLVLDCDGTSSMLECLDYLTGLDIWDSSLFNPQKLQPPSGRHAPGWRESPLLRPGVSHLLLDVLWTGSRWESGFQSSNEVTGDGTVRGVVMLLGVARPNHVMNRLVMVSLKVDGKGSGSCGHFLPGW